MISEHIFDDIPPQLQFLNMVIPLQSRLKLEHCKPHRAAHHLLKCDIINYVKQFPTGYTFANISHPIRCHIIKASALESLFKHVCTAIKWGWRCSLGLSLHLLPYWVYGSTGPCSAFGSETDCRSRGWEFDPGPVSYFCGDWSWNNFYGYSPSCWFKKGWCHLQVKVCVNRLVKLAQEKVWLG